MINEENKLFIFVCCGCSYQMQQNNFQMVRSYMGVCKYGVGNNNFGYNLGDIFWFEVTQKECICLDTNTNKYISTGI